MKISELFGLKKSQHELDFVDVDIDSDTPLFLDPYFIAKNDFPLAYEAHLSLRSYFECLLGALRENRMADAEELFRVYLKTVLRCAKCRKRRRSQRP